MVGVLLFPDTLKERLCKLASILLPLEQYVDVHSMRWRREALDRCSLLCALDEYICGRRRGKLLRCRGLIQKGCSAGAGYTFPKINKNGNHVCAACARGGELHVDVVPCTHDVYISAAVSPCCLPGYG